MAERSPLSPNSDSLSMRRTSNNRIPAAAFSIDASSSISVAARATVNTSGSSVDARAAKPISNVVIAPWPVSRLLITPKRKHAAIGGAM